MRKFLVTLSILAIAGCTSGSGTMPGTPSSGMETNQRARVQRPATCSPTGPLMWMGSGTHTSKRLNGWDSCGVNEWAIHGSNTGITAVTGTSTDPATGNTYVGYGGNTSSSDALAELEIFSPGQNGNATPYEVLGSSAFYCYLTCYTVTPYIDGNSHIWVGLQTCAELSCVSPKLLRFDAGDHGTNVTPEHTIKSTCGNVQSWLGITGDGNAHIFAIGESPYTDSIQEFNEPDNGSSVTPVTCLHGANVAGALVYPSGIGIGHNGKTYVTNYGSGSSASGPGSVEIWNAGDTGNISPEHSIAGSLTGISHPVGLAISGATDGYSIYVADTGAGEILKFAAGTTGNTAPETTYSISDVIGFSICPATITTGGAAECSTTPSARRKKPTVR